MDVLISSVAGVITGAIGSLVAPWANVQQSHSAALIEETRKLLNEPPSSQDFRSSELFSRLRPHLSLKAIKAVEGETDDKGNEVTVVCMSYGRGGGVFSGQLTVELLFLLCIQLACRPCCLNSFSDSLIDSCIYDF